MLLLRWFERYPSTFAFASVCTLLSVLQLRRINDTLIHCQHSLSLSKSRHHSGKPAVSGADIQGTLGQQLPTRLLWDGSQKTLGAATLEHHSGDMTEVHRV
jgi:hypothetical protein